MSASDRSLKEPLLSISEEPISPATPSSAVAIELTTADLRNSGIYVPSAEKKLIRTEQIAKERQVQRRKRRQQFATSKQRELDLERQLEEEPVHIEDADQEFSDSYSDHPESPTTPSTRSSFASGFVKIPDRKIIQTQQQIDRTALAAERKQREEENQRILEETVILGEKPEEPEFALIELRHKPNSKFEFRVSREARPTKTSEGKSRDDDSISAQYRDVDLSVAGENEGIPLTDFSKPWVAVLADPERTHEESYPEAHCFRKALSACKTPTLHIMSFILPAAFTMNAALGGTNLSFETLTMQQLKDLPGDDLAWLIGRGASSQIINYLSNLKNIPSAFESVGDIKEKFRNAPVQSFLAVTFATGAALAAGAIGASSFAWAGTGWAAFNACTNGFLFWATRFYGIVNLLKRRDKYASQGDYETLLNRLANDDEALRTLAEEYTEEFNQFIESEKAGRSLDKEMIYDLLKAILLVQRKDTDFKVNREKCKEMWEVMAWAVAIGGALAVAPAYAYKMLQGSAGIEKFVRGGISSIEGWDIWGQRVFGFIGGCATPVMYFNAMSQLVTTFVDTIAALKSSTTSWWRKAVFPVVLFANGLASMSGYKIARDVNVKDDSLTKDWIPIDSFWDNFDRWYSAASVGMVNGKFAIGELLPPPKHVVKRHSASVAHMTHAPSSSRIEIQAVSDPETPRSESKNGAELKSPLIDSRTTTDKALLKFFVQDAAKSLAAKPLAAQAIESLRNAAKGTPVGQREAYAPAPRREPEGAIPDGIMKGGYSLVDIDEDHFSKIATPNAGSSSSSTTPAARRSALRPSNSAPSINHVSFIVGASAAASRPGDVKLAVPTNRNTITRV